jgi:hypothetical protein
MRREGIDQLEIICRARPLRRVLSAARDARVGCAGARLSSSNDFFAFRSNVLARLVDEGAVEGTAVLSDAMVASRPSV